MTYETPAPDYPGHLPKLRRTKRKSGGLKASRKLAEKTEPGVSAVHLNHNETLDLCHAELERRQLQFLHIPDAVYQMISPPIPNKLTGDMNPLSFALENTIGRDTALAIKKEVAAHIKGAPDTIVFVPIGPGVSVALVDDVKTGAGRLNAAQRRWGNIETSGTVDQFTAKLEKFLTFAAAAQQLFLRGGHV